MLFKIFKQKGKDVIINIDNIVSIKTDEVSGKTIIHSVSETNEVDETFDAVKKVFGVGPKTEIKGF